MKYIFFLLILFSQLLSAQSINGSFEFQTDPAKKYSLYVPSDYDPNTPQAMMLGLHPLNTSRWDAEAWRDTLIQFSEINNLLLVCPDGGTDGKVDDAIDQDFTTALMDSVAIWYNIDQDQKYIMGFSWGGKTTYTYGLPRADEFKGFLVIGAAVDLGEVNGIISASENENFFLVHGANDSPAIRFTPLLNALDQAGACTNSNLMSGVGHNIDFPDRNAILTEAFQWLKTNDCGMSSTLEVDDQIEIRPNPFTEGFYINGEDLSAENISLHAMDGKAIPFSLNSNYVKVLTDLRGVILMTIIKDGNTFTRRMIRQ